MNQLPESKRIFVQFQSVLFMIIGLIAISVTFAHQPFTIINLSFFVVGSIMLATGIIIIRRPSIQEACIKEASPLLSPIVNKTFGEKLMIREPNMAFFGVSGNLYDIFIHETGLSFLTDIPFQDQPKVFWPRNLPSSFLWEDIETVEHPKKWVERLTIRVRQPDGIWRIIIEQPSPKTLKLLLERVPPRRA